MGELIKFCIRCFLVLCSVDAIYSQALKLNTYKDKDEIKAISKEQAIEETLKPFTGKYNEGVDSSTLYGKAIVGYQGWFRCDGDSSGMGWTHYKGDHKDRAPGPGNISIDMWPDLSEFDEDELYDTGYVDSNGKVRKLFSSVNYKTVMRHFSWMKDAGIDGVMHYRFLNSARRPYRLRAKNIVLHNIRAGANEHGRTYSIKYDVSSLKAGESKWILEDWLTLVEKFGLLEDKAYQRHKGRPVIAITHIGRTVPTKSGSQKTGITVDEGIEMVKTLREDPKYGNPCIVWGTPSRWRGAEAVDYPQDSRFEQLTKMVDVIHPWTVGGYKNFETFEKFINETIKGDIEFCKANGLDYLPVVNPGFSRHNRKGDGLGKVPRLKGKYLSVQYERLMELGVNMIFQAIFDEMDEGTAIFKITNDPPEQDQFVTYEGLDPDFYMNMVGEYSKKLREIPVEKIENKEEKNYSDKQLKRTLDKLSE